MSCDAPETEVVFSPIRSFIFFPVRLRSARVLNTGEWNTSWSWRSLASRVSMTWTPRPIGTWTCGATRGGRWRRSSESPVSFRTAPRSRRELQLSHGSTFDVCETENFQNMSNIQIFIKEKSSKQIRFDPYYLPTLVASPLQHNSSSSE